MRHYGSLPIFFLACSCLGGAGPAPSEWPEVVASASADPQRLADARAARAVLLRAPRDEEAIIWYGRRLGYLGLYGDAIAVYTRGLTYFPRSPKLLRHRGHRRISTRDFKAAVVDFERAAALIKGRPDEVEPDGMPNKRNIPTSTLHTNIWYHLGLARYCRGEFEQALRCYESCLRAAKNPDMQVATRYWKFLAATRCEDEAAAAAAHAGVDADWDVIENHAYHRLLLLFRGDLDLATLDLTSDDEVKNLTAAYGLARYRFLAGDIAAGTARLQEIAAARSAAFGCIAAEADLSR